MKQTKAGHSMSHPGHPHPQYLLPAPGDEVAGLCLGQGMCGVCVCGGSPKCILRSSMLHCTPPPSPKPGCLRDLCPTPAPPPPELELRLGGGQGPHDTFCLIGEQPWQCRAPQSADRHKIPISAKISLGWLYGSCQPLA